MIELNADEARVLGVLIEKAMTTPDQYPLSLNAVVNGANQKNNRDPVLTMEEGQAFAALEGLRGQGLVIRSDMVGSRVNKYKHAAGEALHARPGELAILAELMLRGPQTLGELRGRASRMHPFETLDDAKNMLTALATREQAMVKELPPAPGSRAERYMQLLAPDAHPISVTEQSAGGSGVAPAYVAPTPLASRVTALEAEVSLLRETIRKLAQSLGEADPFPPAQ
ncbi:MAG TPA: YceH family protein [Humisphaera sp.]|jgi:hypothetical protein|nr:YceH family protein [Humisphaera sp.]